MAVYDSVKRKKKKNSIQPKCSCLRSTNLKTNLILKFCQLKTWSFNHCHRQKIVIHLLYKNCCAGLIQASPVSSRKLQISPAEMKVEKWQTRRRVEKEVRTPKQFRLAWSLLRSILQYTIFRPNENRRISRLQMQNNLPKGIVNVFTSITRKCAQMGLFQLYWPNSP